MRFAFLTGATFLLVGISAYFLEQRTSTPARYSLTQIDIADTSAKREQGLSGRVSLTHDYGMLFVFPKAGNHAFWMKDMFVPIDIIWLTDDGAIAGIEHSVASSTFPKTFYPPYPVRYVLEVRAGLAAELGWHMGKELSLPLP